MGIKKEQHLLVKLDGEKIIREKTTGILNKLQRRFKDIPGSLSKELIEERRAEAAKENHDS